MVVYSSYSQKDILFDIFLVGKRGLMLHISFCKQREESNAYFADVHRNYNIDYKTTLQTRQG